MKFAMLFPGQGSQSVGMLAQLSEAHGVVDDTLQEAAEHLGWDVRALCRDGPAEELNRTEKTQPALLAAGIAVWRAWERANAPAPVALAGHSLGEYTALVAAQSLAFRDALKLVERRGQLMQQAVPQGAGGMVAVIGMEDGDVEALCARCDKGVLEPVNYNAPGQVVVAGESAALDWLEAEARPAGARMAMRLPVSVPSHCSLMKDAAERLAESLAETAFATPRIPVLHNLDAVARSEGDSIREALKEQLYRPVRWTQAVQSLAKDGVALFLECGPGKVLSGLNKRIGKFPSIALESPEGFDKALADVVA